MRSGGWAMILGAVMGLVTMAFHPTGHETMADFQRMAPINVGAHALALLAIPVAFFGAMALAERLSASPMLARFALVTYGMAQGAVMIAAVASGILSTMLMARLLGATGAEAETARTLLRFTGLLNNAFAMVFVGASSLAIALWSAAMWRTRAFPRWLAVLGVAVGIVLLVITLAGRLRLDVHHFGMVVIAQAVWLIGSGVMLVRAAPDAAR